jgi:RNA recognition motif-containing protein
MIFLQYEKVDDARAAQQALNGLNLAGKEMKVRT